MHIHFNAISPNPADPHTAAAARAAYAQRTENTRKRLLKAGDDLEGDGSDEFGAIFGRWMESGNSPGQGQSQSQGQGTASGRGHGHSPNQSTSQAHQPAQTSTPIVSRIQTYGPALDSVAARGLSGNEPSVAMAISYWA